ncbi:hypothetical protein [Streptomyces sp. NBC_00338]|uniref:hypothetical protein n=1 Tax=Streptomyces sp. NBC_00338 TaxID=2975715 RepID=UPI00224E65BB|nr:hypothetical protein [Streptomyces sp. NBC_00338]MCX5143043.1 hypothetical protein [Streptomyces sp. NBC_00338]
MAKPKSAAISDLPDLTGTSLEALRARPDDDRAAAKKRLLEEVGRSARSLSTGGENSWTV